MGFFHLLFTHSCSLSLYELLALLPCQKHWLKYRAEKPRATRSQVERARDVPSKSPKGRSETFDLNQPVAPFGRFLNNSLSKLWQARHRRRRRPPNSFLQSLHIIRETRGNHVTFRFLYVTFKTLTKNNLI